MSLRAELLDKAKQLTMSDRNKEYGEPWENLTNIAYLWTAYFHAKFGSKIVDEVNFSLSAEDVAHLNILQKMARTFLGKPKPDTYIDMAAYAAIAGEVAQEDAYDER